MTQETLEKPAKQLSSTELRALLKNTEAAELQERQQKRTSYENLRDDVVLNLISEAITLKEVLKAYKVHAYKELEALYKLLQEHSQRYADGKGTFTVENNDRTMRVRYIRHDATMFDERATQAEKYILDFLTSEFSDDDPKSKLIKKLIERKKGKVDKDNVLLLAGMKDEFPNDNFHKGIELYLESIVPSHTKFYAQFYIRPDVDSEWQNIVLDFARL